MASKTFQAITGPKPKAIDPEHVKFMAMFMCTPEEIAMFYEFSERQLYRRLAKDPELRDAFHRGRAMGRRLLKKAQWDLAMAGDAGMLRWLGQNILGQSSRVTAVAEDLNPGKLDDALDVEFTEIFEEIDAEIKEEGLLLEHSDGATGTGDHSSGGTGPGNIVFED